MSEGVNAPVAARVSATSLELSLENDKLKVLRAEYVKALEDKATAGDIVGFVFAVNGRINSADVYPSNGLFRKMWAKLLAASVTEAVGEKNVTSAADAPSVDAVREFLAAAEKGESNAGKVGNFAPRNRRPATAKMH